MFKIRPESPEFKTLDEVKAKTYLALSYTMLTKGTNKKTAVLFNESQWIGKILFPRRKPNMVRIWMNHWFSTAYNIVNLIKQDDPEFL